MSKSVNRVILIGRLGKPPEISYTPSGAALCKFSLATDRRFKDKSGEYKTETDWHNCVVWGKSAEYCGKYLLKGSQVYIEGRISYRTWEDKQGNKKYATDITAEQVTALDSKERETVSAGAVEPFPTEIDESDLPF